MTNSSGINLAGVQGGDAEAVASLVARIHKPSPDLVRLISAIYAKGGSGKTSLLATMPGRGLVLDIPQVEGGTMVLSEHANRIDVLEMNQWSDFALAYRMLRFGQHEYKWVAIDTLTAAQELAKRKTINDRDQLAADPHTLSQQEWGKIGNLVAELIYRFKGLTVPNPRLPNFRPVHVILLGQERGRDNAEGVRELQPDITPASLTALIPSMFLIGRLYVRQVTGKDGKLMDERRLRVGTHHLTVTKSRTLPSRPLPPVIRNPNLGLIFGYLLGGKVPPPESVVEEDGLGGGIELE